MSVISKNNHVWSHKEMLEKGSMKKWTIQRHWKFWTPDTERRQIKHNTENYKKKTGNNPRCSRSVSFFMFQKDTTCYWIIVMLSFNTFVCNNCISKHIRVTCLLIALIVCYLFLHNTQELPQNQWVRSADCSQKNGILHIVSTYHKTAWFIMHIAQYQFILAN